MNDEKHVCYFCGGEGKYFFKTSQHWCCSKYYCQCPAEKEKARNKNLGINNPMYKKDPWNKGLTKEIDERVLKYSQSVKRTKSTKTYVAWNKGLTKEIDERVLKYISSMIKTKNERRQNGSLKKRKIVPIWDSFCKCREKFYSSVFKKMLYSNWKIKVLTRDNFQCVVCGTKENLEVHHLKPFREIFKESCDEIRFKY